MPSAPSHFTGSWRVAAVVVGILCLGLVATLITVGFMKGIDALAAIALTLAVIAFIAQLVIYAIQTMQSGAQLREAQQLNTQTREMVGEVRSRIDTTYQMVSSHNDMLLKMSSLKNSEDASPIRATEPVTPSSERAESAMRRFDQFRALPSVEDCIKILNKLEPLPDGSIKALSVNAVHAYMAEIYQMDQGDLAYAETDAPLIAAGLAEPAAKDKVKLTPEGYAAGRVFTSAWPPGEEYEEILDRLRDLRDRASATALTIFTSVPDELRGRSKR